MPPVRFKLPKLSPGTVFLITICARTHHRVADHLSPSASRRSLTPASKRKGNLWIMHASLKAPEWLLTTRTAHLFFFFPSPPSFATASSDQRTRSLLLGTRSSQKYCPLACNNVALRNRFLINVRTHFYWESWAIESTPPVRVWGRWKRSLK